MAIYPYMHISGHKHMYLCTWIFESSISISLHSGEKEKVSNLY